MAVNQEKSDDSYIQGAQFKLPKKILDAELEAIRWGKTGDVVE